MRDFLKLIFICQSTNIC